MRNPLKQLSILKNVTTYMWDGNFSTKKKHVLIACMPKSGSSFVTQVLSQLPGFKARPQLPEYGRREQELDVFSLLCNANANYVAQHHIRYSKATDSLIQRFNVQTVFLTRNIFDACISFRDHIRRESHIAPMGFIEEDAAQWDDERLENFLADMIMPWYFNFYMSWIHCEQKYHATYEELNRDPIGTIEKIIHYCDIETANLNLETLISSIDPGSARKNVGKIGRGDQLHATAREKIVSYSRYYPDVDFSSIGIRHT